MAGATNNITENTTFATDLNFSDQKPRWQFMLEAAFPKEIRIALAKGQSLRRHKAPFPIVAHFPEGCIDLGVHGQSCRLGRGILTLDANVPHDLFARGNGVVRLTLSKQDTVERVEEVIKSSLS